MDKELALILESATQEFVDAMMQFESVHIQTVEADNQVPAKEA